jgi:hypothetical protein
VARPTADRGRRNAQPQRFELVTPAAPFPLLIGIILLETSILKHIKTMAFIIQFNSELACPRVQCDHCGEIIDDPAIAIAAWDEPFHQEGAVYATRFHHKECDGKVKPPLQRWMQLDEYLARILANLGVTARKLHRFAS